MVRRRKRAAATEKPLDLIETPPYGQKPELSGEAKYAGELPAGVGEELPGSQTLAAELEMPFSQELEAEQARLELVGTTRGQESPAGQNFRAELHGESRDALRSQPYLSQRN
jgi:hypothetical protein